MDLRALALAAALISTVVGWSLIMFLPMHGDEEVLRVIPTPLPDGLQTTGVDNGERR